LKRRNFIVLGVGGAVGVLLATGVIQYLNGDSSKVLSSPEMLTYLFGEEELDLIGQEYLETHLKMNSEEKILGVLTDGMDIKNLESEVIKQELTIKIKNDFENQNTVIVRGILMSHTEALQCSLKYLS
jgi:hypothetical protein